MAADVNNGNKDQKHMPNNTMKGRNEGKSDKMDKFVHPIKIEFKPQNPLKTAATMQEQQKVR